MLSFLFLEFDLASFDIFHHRSDLFLKLLRSPFMLGQNQNPEEICGALRCKSLLGFIFLLIWRSLYLTNLKLTQK